MKGQATGLTLTGLDGSSFNLQVLSFAGAGLQKLNLCRYKWTDDY